MPLAVLRHALRGIGCAPPVESPEHVCLADMPEPYGKRDTNDWFKRATRSHRDAFEELHLDERNLEIASVHHVMMNTFCSKVRCPAVQINNPGRTVRLLQQKLTVRERHDEVIMLVNMPARVVALHGKAPFGHSGPLILHENRAAGGAVA